ncbi:MAG: 30S ribosomal protein S21 [SAR202 cluster bacterium]|nr:30S ribosomal protein S21 [SAR202 cluster bacterium]
MAYVTIRDGEDSEGLLKRFQSQMQRSGIMRELRNRRSFLSKGERRRLERQRSIRRARRRIRNSRMRQ